MARSSSSPVRSRSLARMAVGRKASSARRSAASVLREAPRAAFSAISGSFSADSTAPTISLRQTADLNGNGYIDAVHISFSEAVLDSTVAAAAFDVAGVSGEAFSSTTAGDTADDADLWITFADGVLGTAQTPTVTYTAGTLTDLAGNPLGSTGAVASTDAAGPAIWSAVASDATVVQTGIDADDTVTLTFSEATNQPAINAGNINAVLGLSGGHSWLDGAGGISSAVWSTASSLVVTLRDTTSDPTVAVGDSITLNGTTITDGPNFSFSVRAAAQVMATMGSSVAPDTRSANQMESNPRPVTMGT